MIKYVNYSIIYTKFIWYQSKFHRIYIIQFQQSLPFLSPLTIAVGRDRPNPSLPISGLCSSSASPARIVQICCSCSKSASVQICRSPIAHYHKLRRKICFQPGLCFRSLCRSVFPSKKLFVGLFFKFGLVFFRRQYITKEFRVVRGVYRPNLKKKKNSKSNVYKK